MYLRVAYISLLLLVFCKYSSAQREPNLVNITQQDGLPSNETYCVYKDSKGYIWSSGDQGVVRHKGTSMQVINYLPDNVVFKIREDSKGRIWFFSKTGKLAYFYKEKVYPYKYNDSIAKYISRININDGYVSDSDEIILNSKPIEFNFEIKKDGKILKLNKNNPEDSSLIWWNIQISEWDNNRLFVQVLNPFESIHATQYVKISLKNNKGIIHYDIPFTEYSNMLQYGAIKLKNNNILFFGSKYIVLLKSNGDFIVKEFPAVVLSLFNDENNGAIWVGLSKSGIVKINEQLDVLERWMCGNNSVTSFALDGEGEIWFSTLENGIYYTRNSNKQNRYFSQISYLPTQRIVNAMDSIIYFANATGIYKLVDDSAINVFKENNTTVGDLLLTKQRNLYFNRSTFIEKRDIQKYTTDKSFTRYTTLKFHKLYKIKNQLFNNLVCNQNGDEILKLNEKYYLERNGFSTDLIPATIKEEEDLYHFSKLLFRYSEAKMVAILVKNSNTLFLGTESKLAIYEIDTFNTFKPLINRNTSKSSFRDNIYIDSINYYTSVGTFRDFKDTTGLFAKGITNMRQMTNGIIAVGLRFGGIALMEDTTIIGNISEANGLLSNSIKYILPDSNRLWLATPQGISVIQFSSFHPLKYTITNFGENVGFNNMIIYQLITFKKGILVATSKGIYEIRDIEKLLQQKPPPIPLYITTLNYYKGDTSGISSITLPYEHNRIIVNFDAICYNTPKELQYYYRLINSDNDTTWRILTSTQLILENLSPDKYELQIKAEIPKQQRYSEIQKLTIIVAKPWWQWNAVRFGAILLFLLLVYAVYKWRVHTIEKRETEKTALRTQMAELQQTALRSQMNPHFIFNCLTSIQQLLLLGNREEANDYLVKFSRLIRKTLELSVHPYSNLAQEKEYLTEYLELEQLRTPDHFDFCFNIDKDIDICTTAIPNMMLQPIIENCIRHGIKHLQDRKGMITVNITKKGHCINCVVTDNGVGRKKLSLLNSLASHKSYGMEIVRKRLTGLANYKPEDYFVKIIDLIDESEKPIGTKVIVQLPFKIVST